MDVVALVLGFAVSALSAWALAVLLPRAGLTVPDVMKGGRAVAHPGGPALFAGLAIGLGILWALWGDVRVLAVLMAAGVALVIGLADDFLVLPGPLKVAGTVLTAVPILLLGAYVPRPLLPFVGAARLTLVYPLVILIGMPVAANAVNMIDVVNGVVSAGSAMVALAVAGYEAIAGSPEGMTVALMVTSVSLGFWLLHRYPSKILPGDSGSLMLGATLAALAFSYRAEIVVVAAMLPEAMNGFFIISSVKSLVEHRRMEARPTVAKKGMVVASRDPRAPITLVRMLAAGGPLSERQVGRRLLALQAYSCLLALLTGLMI